MHARYTRQTPFCLAKAVLPTRATRAPTITVVPAKAIESRKSPFRCEINRPQTGLPPTAAPAMNTNAIPCRSLDREGQDLSANPREGGTNRFCSPNFGQVIVRDAHDRGRGQRNKPGGKEPAQHGPQNEHRLAGHDSLRAGFGASTRNPSN